MAGIDKTYVSSWEDYKEIRDWAIKTNVTYPNGDIGSKMINWFYFPDLTEDNFKENKEYVLWNTSELVDMFLYKHCPFELVQERLKEQYSDLSYLDRAPINEHEIGNHFIIPKKFINRIVYGQWYCIEVKYNERYWGYNAETNQWVSTNELGKFHQYWLYIKLTSRKALARQIRNWNLPKGAIISINCIRYLHKCKIVIRK